MNRVKMIGGPRHGKWFYYKEPHPPFGVDVYTLKNKSYNMMCQYDSDVLVDKNFKIELPVVEYKLYGYKTMFNELIYFYVCKTLNPNKSKTIKKIIEKINFENYKKIYL